MTGPAMLCTVCAELLTTDEQRLMGRCRRHRRVCAVQDCHNPVPAEHTDRVCSTRCRARRKAQKARSAPQEPAPKRRKRRSRPTSQQAGTGAVVSARRGKQKQQGKGKSQRPNPPRPTRPVAEHAATAAMAADPRGVALPQTSPLGAMCRHAVTLCGPAAMGPAFLLEAMILSVDDPPADAVLGWMLLRWGPMLTAHCRLYGDDPAVLLNELRLTLEAVAPSEARR